MLAALPFQATNVPGPLQIPGTPDTGPGWMLVSLLESLLLVAAFALLVYTFYRFVWRPVTDRVRYDRRE